MTPRRGIDTMRIITGTQYIRTVTEALLSAWGTTPENGRCTYERRMYEGVDVVVFTLTYNGQTLVAPLPITEELLKKWIYETF
jgi:hypothetical protein